MGGGKHQGVFPVLHQPKTVMETGRGNFEWPICLGIILLLSRLNFINLILTHIQAERASPIKTIAPPSWRPRPSRDKGAGAHLLDIHS